MALNVFLIHDLDTGIFLRFDGDHFFNTEFLAKLFMQPYFQFTSYLWGVMLCFSYIRYIQERAGHQDESRNS
jgi:hypothetical protein